VSCVVLCGVLYCVVVCCVVLCCVVFSCVSFVVLCELCCIVLCCIALWCGVLEVTHTHQTPISKIFVYSGSTGGWQWVRAVTIILNQM
jgi:hypothetical protein